MIILINHSQFSLKSKCHIVTDCGQSKEIFTIPSNLMQIDFDDISNKYKTNDIRITNLNDHLKMRLEKKFSNLKFTKIDKKKE